MKNPKRALRTTGLAVLLALCGVSVIADDGVPAQYAVAVVEDTAHGEAILAGNIELAIEQLATRSDRRFSTQNNLCVAHILARDIRAAKKACDAAVSRSAFRARGASFLARGASFRHLSNPRVDYAYALTNRGVALALGGQMEAAERDFQLATKKGPRLPEPAANLRRLEGVMQSVVAKR